MDGVIRLSVEIFYEENFDEDDFPIIRHSKKLRLSFFDTGMGIKE